MPRLFYLPLVQPGVLLSLKAAIKIAGEDKPLRRFPCLFSEFSSLLALNRSLCRRKARNRHAERRAGNIGKADVMAELNGARIAAMLAADAQLCLLYTSERTVCINGDDDRDNQADIILCALIEFLRERHNVHTVLTQRRTDRGCRGCFSGGDLQLN